MMEQNYKLGLALRGPSQNDVAMMVDGVDDDGNSEDDMMVDDGETKKKKRGKASDEFKAKVVDILEKNDFADKRASKMSQDDFLQLLAHFNESGIHFA